MRRPAKVQFSEEEPSPVAVEESVDPEPIPIPEVHIGYHPDRPISRRNSIGTGLSSLTRKVGDQEAMLVESRLAIEDQAKLIGELRRLLADAKQDVAAAKHESEMLRKELIETNQQLNDIIHG